MTITTKLSIGDTVFFMHKNAVQSCVVRGITVTVEAPLHYANSTHVIYRIDSLMSDENQEITGVLESSAFPSKANLLASL